MKKYIIQDREAGNQIDEFNTYEEAKEQLGKYEAEDREDGVFEEDFYEIVEVEKEKTNIAIHGKAKSEAKVFEIYRDWFLDNFTDEADRDYLRYEAFDLIESYKNFGIPFEEFEAGGIIGNHAWSIATIVEPGRDCFRKALAFVNKHI